MARNKVQHFVKHFRLHHAQSSKSSTADGVICRELYRLVTLRLMQIFPIKQIYIANILGYHEDNITHNVFVATVDLLCYQRQPGCIFPIFQ